MAQLYYNCSHLKLSTHLKNYQIRWQNQPSFACLPSSVRRGLKEPLMSAFLNQTSVKQRPVGEALLPAEK
ncbi:MAG: hypothetical protein AUG45_02545 [Ktedonobacter sp. 13_1_20CM_3_54_15]|nr:MAG: hypothetical protein AUG45_02545 [Ktedonobacter sp. 13_1_20CM_3_54_15]